MSKKTYSRVERVLIALILLGMAGMFQPFAITCIATAFCCC